MAADQFWTIFGMFIVLLGMIIGAIVSMGKLFSKLDTKIDSVAAELRQEIHGQAIRIDQVLLAVGDLRSDMGKLQGDIKIIQNHLGLSQTA